jgi:heat shock protein HslJ
MKKFYLNLLTTLMVAILSIGLMSCSSDDDNDFNFSNETLYGTWQITKVKTSETDPYTTWMLNTTTATFNSDGTYSGAGYFGNGSGKYTAKGNTITTYVSGNVYMIYTVLSLNNTTAELKISEPGSNEYIWIICSKK